MAGSEVNDDGFRWFPVRGDLQNGRPAQATMRDQHFFAKLLRPTGGNHPGGDARQMAILFAVLSAERKRHQRRTALADRHSELPRNLVTQPSRTHFRNRQASCGHHQGRSTEFIIMGKHREPGGAPSHSPYLYIEEYLHSRAAALFIQHVYDFAGGMVTEKLAQGLLVVGNAVFFHQFNEISRAITGQRRLTEMGIAGKKVLRTAIQVSEIAAAAPGNQYLLADTL